MTDLTRGGRKSAARLNFRLVRKPQAVGRPSHLDECADNVSTRRNPKMLKLTLLTAFAATTAVSFAQGMMMVPDAKSSKPAELSSFLNKDAYEKLNAPDAYYLTQFVGSLPGNYQTALLRGLVGNAQEARTIRDKNQTAANMMAPMGDMEKPVRVQLRQLPEGHPLLRDGHDGPAVPSELPRRPELPAEGSGFDRPGPSRDPFHAQALHRRSSHVPLQRACRRYDRPATIKANAKSTQPVRLKYTSLAPRTYVSPMIPR